MKFDHFRLIDLTHPLSPNIPTWDGSCGFSLETKNDHPFQVQQITMQAGIGTHMDAPSHRIQGGASIADIPLEQIIAAACVINVSKKATANYEISPEDIEQYEASHGKIPDGSLVIAYTGWSRFWSDPLAYRNADPTGQMHFPAFSPNSIELLLKRNIAGIAIDTLSPDCANTDYPVHKLLLGAGKYIIENIADCAQLPPHGSFVIALPLRIEHGTEAPIRIVGLIPK